jgi:hypothetical protein
MTDKRPSNGSCLDAALDYLARGWSVVPLRAGGKVPPIAWQAFQERRAEPAEVRDWYRRWPGAGVGVVTGAISRLAVIDIDPRHGGAESLFAWQERHGPLPPTVEALTGGGGTHLYFISSNAALRNRVAVLPGVDLRARGGLVVAPPSLHASGRRYAWRAGHAPADRPPAPLPRVLHELLRRDGERRGHSLDHWRRLTREGVAEGARNTTIASLCGHLLWHGVDPEVALELLAAWNRARCHPPLPDEEVARVVASIDRAHHSEDGEGS